MRSKRNSVIVGHAHRNIMFRIFQLFFLIEKNNIYVSVQRVVCCSHQSDRLGYVTRTNQIAASGYVSRTNQSVFFFLWFERCSNFNEVRGDSVRAVRKMESSFRMRMVDSCSREIGVLCTVARSWLLFLHDESEWKNFESNIAWGVDELHQTFWFEQFFNGKLRCKIHDLLSVPAIFFWIGLLGAISRWMSD